MRKLLSVLGVLSLASTPITTIISCKPKANSTNNNDPFEDNELNNLPVQIRRMVTNTNFITKLILLGRHENLNYNINEILSMYITPVSTAQWLPFSYTVTGDGSHGTVKGKQYAIDLGKYINGFLDNMTNLRAIDASYNGYGGIYASYVMGMYDDDFYRNFVKNKIFSDFSDKNGDVTKPLGYNAGAGLQLSDDINRRNLAWGIQDTGALTNYLLNNGFHGGNPQGIGASPGPSSAPKGTTNYDGYLFYNSHLFNPDKNSATIGDGQKINNILKPYNLKVTQDIKNYGVTLTDLSGKYVLPKNQPYFGSMQSFITQQGGSLNRASKINQYLSLVKNFTESVMGATYGTTLISQMFPMVENTQSHEGFLLFGMFAAAVGETLKEMGDINKYPQYKDLGLSDNSFQTTVQNYLDAMKTAGTKMMGSYNNSTSWVTQLLSPSVGITIPKFMDNDADVFGKLNLLINQLKTIYQGWNQTQKDKFSLDLIGYQENSTPKGFLATKFYNLISLVQPTLASSFFNKDFVASLNVLKLLSGLGTTAKTLSDSKDQILALGKKFDGQQYGQLSNTDRMYIASQLGNDNGKYKPGSLFKVLSDSFTNPQADAYDAIVKIFYNSNAPFRTMVGDQMKDVHDKFLVNAIANDNWNISNVKVKGDSSIIGSTMSYTMDYTGLGDPTVSLYKKGQPKIGDDFNPYQQATTAKPLVSGGNEDYIKYDGLGNFQDYQKVHHRYEVTWKNVSNSPDNPYWIIVGINNFDLASGKPEQFYNIY